jgi:hypothetical protein
MRFLRSQNVLVTVSLATVIIGHVAADAAESDASAGPCFQILPPVLNREPASPILFNKCTGDTWLLVKKNGRAGHGKRVASYRWQRMEVDNTMPQRTSVAGKPAATGPDSPSSAVKNRNCFMFNARQFCE